MKQQLELPTLTIVLKDIATTLNSNTLRKKMGVDCAHHSQHGSGEELKTRDNLGFCYKPKSEKPEAGHSYPVQMCLDLSTPET